MSFALILPDSFASYKDVKGEKLSSLLPFNKINMIVGANNSGKSRFMRVLSSQEQYEIRSSKLDLVPLNAELISILDELINALGQWNLTSADELSVEKLESLKKFPDTLSTTRDEYAEARSSFSKWSQVQNFSRYSSKMSVHSYPDGRLEKNVRTLAEKGLKVLEGIPLQSRSSTPKRVYIPILRGLRPLDADHTDFYFQRTREDYFSGQADTARPEIYTGLSFYQRLTDLLLGSNAERKQIVEYQKFISNELFEGREVVLIPSQKNKAVTIKIGKETEQPVHHLGDGVQAAIILSFLPFVTQDPTFFFIEEPESHMHPGLQRKVLELFARDQKHTFFLTTHSNHLLDITIDLKETSIFNFRKSLDQDADDDEQLSDVIVEAVNVGSQSSLEQLGVRNSSVFLVNATIWVEGITDRWYLRALLRSYVNHLEKGKVAFFKPEEDVHYSFVEYGGNNITHWSFLEDEDHPIEVERLCARAMVVADQDGDTKLARKQTLEAKLEDRFCLVEGREVENILPAEIIRNVVASYEKQPSQELPGFDFESYQYEYIGAYIQKELSAVKRKGGYESASGTIKGKVEFCRRASALLEEFEFEHLPDSTQSLGKRIYVFIEENNKL